MTEYTSIESIRAADGLRMAVLRGVPSPWSEAAKGIFRVKRLQCAYGAQSEGDPEQAITKYWGDSSVPVVLWNDEKPRKGWAEILILAERLTDSSPLIPDDVEERTDLFGIAHEICGEMGLGWAYRLVMVGEGQKQGQGGFPAGVTRFLAAKYGHNPVHAENALRRVIEILRMLSARLERHEFIVGSQLTAADIYWATFSNLIIPLPEDLMPTVPMIRQAYQCRDERVLEAISPRLAAHQRRVYDEYLELPVQL